MTTRRITTTLVVLALVGQLGACGGGGSPGGGSADPDSETDSETETGETTPAGAVDWERVTPGGDCQCADGSEYSFWVREADPDKVLLYFRAGGACWSAETCAQDGREGSDELYTPAIGPGGDPRPDGTASSTSPTSATRSPTTRSCTSRTAPVTCSSATPPPTTATA